jgi:hypothetical protein
MQVELDFLQMSLLVVNFFRTPISLLCTCHTPFSKNSMPNIQVFQPSAFSAASPAEAEPGAGPFGGGPDRFGRAPNHYTRSRFGPRPKLSGGRRICLVPSLAALDLSPNLLFLLKLAETPFTIVFFAPSPSPCPPPSPWPPPPQDFPPPSPSTQPNLSKLRLGGDRVTWRPSTEGIRVSSTALGDRDLSSSPSAPCLRVSPFDPLLPLALVLLLICSCSCMSRSRVYLGDEG